MGTAKVLLNSDFKEGSKVLMYRDIRKRVYRIAPFLRLDHDPYLIIDNGRLVWMIDAYTYTNRFPYSQSLVNIGNYMRNSVKITVDAYNGNLVFYQMDQDDPIINAWGKVFPNLLTPGTEMPERCVNTSVTHRTISASKPIYMPHTI